LKKVIFDEKTSKNHEKSSFVAVAYMGMSCFCQNHDFYENDDFTEMVIFVKKTKVH
jgi:hypothetical protein